MHRSQHRCQLSQHSPLETRLDIYRLLLIPPSSSCHLHPNIPLEDDGHIYPAILCANHQTHLEAMPIVYSELKLMLNPADVIFLRTPSDVQPPKNCTWRHSPLDGLGHTDGNGRQVYSTPELEGRMEPHIFVRFQNIVYNPYFHYSLYHQGPSYFQVDFGPHYQQVFGIFPRDAGPYGSIKTAMFVRSVGAIRTFTNLLSAIPQLNSLTIKMSVAYSIYKPFPPDIEEKLEGRLVPSSRTTYLPDQGSKAIRRFFLTGGFESLRKVSSFQNFELEILLRDEDQRFGYQELHPREVDMVKDLKHDIEANFVAARTSSTSVSDLMTMDVINGILPLA